jgi:hypothetical protein
MTLVIPVTESYSYCGVSGKLCCECGTTAEVITCAGDSLKEEKKRAADALSTPPGSHEMIARM